MFNIYDYCSINWEATSNRIKSLLKIKEIPIPLFAKLMCVTERTVYNWCNGKEYGKPKLQEMIMMALLLQVDVLDIIIIDGRVNSKIERQDIEEMKEIRDEKTGAANMGMNEEYLVEEDCIIDFMMNEYAENNFAIKNLEEFLLYLPLFEFSSLEDCLSRVNGNIGLNRYYVLQQLNYLYKSIKMKEAKGFADRYKDFYLTYPKIQDIDSGNNYYLNQEKYETWVRSIKDCVEWDKQYEAYAEEYKNFLKTLTHIDA